MLRVAHSSTLLDKKSKEISKKEMRRVNLGDVSDALESGDNSVVVAFFKQGYEPVSIERAPAWIRMILDLDALNAKYDCWKKGLLKC